MKLSDRLLRQLKQVRDTSEKLLDAFQSPEDWTYQLAPGTNHALWFAGHMAVSDNWFISMVAPERANKMEQWETLFGTGSQPTSDPENYPPPAEVLDVMRERRRVLNELLAGRSDKALAKSTPAASFELCPDYGSVWELAIWHEALHAGQVTMVRRALGHAPLFSPAPAETT